MVTFKSVLVLVSFVALAITLTSCENTVTNNGTPAPPDNFQISAWDYSENFYFLDTLYKRSFSEWQEGTITSFMDSNRINAFDNTFEIWVQCDATVSSKRFCVGKVMLGAIPPQGYDTSVTNPVSTLGDKFAGYFCRLGLGYYLNDTAGFAVLNISIPENCNVGVVYTNAMNQSFGKGSYNSSANDTLILKLIKVDSPNPVTTPLAWQLKMKNVYRLPNTGFVPHSTEIFLKYNNLGTIPGYSSPLITMIKLDRFNNATYLPPPDGKFDWLFGKTIFVYIGTDSSSYRGYIMFPILEPFGHGLQDAGVSSEYQFNEIYTQTKTQTQGNSKANIYKLMGTAVYINDK